MKEALEVLNKYGISAGMVIALIWMNSRLNLVEDRLYDCYNEQIIRNRAFNTQDKEIKLMPLQVAILPEPIKPKNDRQKTSPFID